MSKVGMYHPVNNPNGVCRDHIVSKEYGWQNKIDPKLIAHPANCQLLDNLENISKGSDCWMTVEQLEERIANWDLSTFKRTKIVLARSEEHKRRISESVTLHWKNKKTNRLS